MEIRQFHALTNPTTSTRNFDFFKLNEERFYLTVTTGRYITQMVEIKCDRPKQILSRRKRGTRSIASESCQRVNLELYIEERVQSLRVLSTATSHGSKIKSACVESMASGGIGLESKKHFLLEKVNASATGRLRTNLHDFAYCNALQRCPF